MGITIRQQSRVLGQLRGNLAGQVVGPDDLSYETARRVFMLSVDRRPAAIARPVDAADVARAISLVSEAGLELAVRGGGHSAAGHGTSDGGVVLDLRGLTSLKIDVGARVVRAAGGLTSGEVTAAAAPYGLAVGFGDTPSVGIGGLTLGGGTGYLVRKHGLTIDHLLGAEVVTADGRILEVDSQKHSDLFWAIRGGGGNFGVVTRFDYRLHPVDVVTGGMLVLPATPETVAGLVAAVEAARDELSVIASVLPAPPMPFLPAELVGEPILVAMIVHAGSLEAGASAVAQLRGLATPIADFVRPMSFTEMFTMPEQPPPPRAATRTFFSDWLDEAAASDLLDRVRTSLTQLAVVQIRVHGGAVARVASDSTAFAHRQRNLLVNVAAVYTSPEEDAIHHEWADDVVKALSRGEEGAYVNFLSDQGSEGVRAAYPGSTWNRLREVKRHYDPENVFRVNQNINPAESS